MPAIRWSRAVTPVFLLIVLSGCGGSTVAVDEVDTVATPKELHAQPADEQVSPSVPESVTAITDTAFRNAAEKGDLALVKAAIDQGIDVNSPDEGGRTALMMASYYGHQPVVELLLKQAVRVDHYDAVHRTALIYAASGKFPEIVAALLEAGANVNARDAAERWTALMFAAVEGNVEVVRVLLSHGADVTLVDTDGESALDFAVSRGRREVAEALRIAGRE